jgi:signal transduction histidine kinase/CheY-like chemotaxis protein
MADPIAMRRAPETRPGGVDGSALERLQELERTLHSARIGTFDWRAQNDRLAYSSNTSSILGKAGPLPDTLGRFLELIHPADREPTRQRTRGAFRRRGGDFVQLEFRVEGDDGQVRWIRGQGRALRGPDGRAVHAVGTLMDVSDRKALETQLLQSQKMESVGQLAGGLAHDFNNLLTAIFGELELARGEAPQGSELAESLTAIEQAADRARRLTAQLLAFARQQVFELQVCDLGPLLGACSDLLQRILGEDIRLEIHTAPGLWRTFVDAHQLEQVIVNLAVNGREAMAQGGTLTLEAVNRADGECPVPGDHVVLSVRDTGQGMGEAVRLRALEPFFTTKELGTGLGLSTCYGIVEQLGGHLALSSELGTGTEVRVYLPRHRAPVEASEPAARAPERRSEVVLVVEDEPAVRSMTARGLRKHGYTVIEATHGSEALNHLRDGREVDVLVADVVMPGISGRDLAERAVALSPDTRVLFVSGHAEEVIGRHGLDGVEHRFLQKPFTPAMLVGRIRELMGPGGGAATLA